MYAILQRVSILRSRGAPATSDGCQSPNHYQLLTNTANEAVNAIRNLCIAWYHRPQYDDAKPRGAIRQSAHTLDSPVRTTRKAFGDAARIPDAPEPCAHIIADARDPGAAHRPRARRRSGRRGPGTGPVPRLLGPLSAVSEGVRKGRPNPSWPRTARDGWGRAVGAAADPWDRGRADG
jgi:hypothetical protein